MVKKLQILFTFAVFGVIYMAQSNNSGPGWQYTSAPSEGSCVSCHSSSSLVTSGYRHSRIKLVHTMSGGGYKPDSTYNLVITFKDTLRFKTGFQIVALDGTNSPAGTFSTADSRTQTGTAVVNSKTRSYIGHTSSGTANVSSDSTSWKIKWKAPSTNVGKVTFYINLCSTNGNSANSGDIIYAKTFEINPSSFLPTAKINTPSSNCQKTSIKFSATVTGSPTIYAWNFLGGIPSTSNVANPSVVWTTTGSKTILLSVTNSSGKSKTDTLIMNIGQNANTPSISSVTGTGPNFNKCQSDNIKLFINKSNLETYVWLPDSVVTDTFTTSVANTYKVRAIRNSTGCFIESSNAIVSNFATQSYSLTRVSFDTICIGDSAKFKLSGINKVGAIVVNHNGNTVASTTGALNYSFLLNTPGLHTYTVTAADSNGCAMADQSVTFYVKDKITGPILLPTTRSYSSLKFNWNPLAGATAYEISLDNGPWITTGNSGTNTFYQASNLASNTKMNFAVRAIVIGQCITTKPALGYDSTLPCPNITFDVSNDTFYCGSSKVLLTISNVSINPYLLFVNNDSFLNATSVDLGVKSGQGLISAYMTDTTKTCYSATKQILYKYDTLKTVGKLAQKSYVVCKNTAASDLVDFSLNNASASMYKWYVNGILATTTTNAVANLSVKNGDNIFAVQQKGACTANSDTASTVFTGALDCKLSVTRVGVTNNFTVAANTPAGVHAWKIGDSTINENSGNFTYDFGNYRGSKKYIKHSINNGPNCKCSDSTLVDFGILAIKGISNLDFTVSPNPANTQFIINLTKTANATYKLYDIGGKLVKLGQLKNGTGTVTVDDLTEGVYQLVLQTAEGMGTLQLSIVK